MLKSGSLRFELAAALLLKALLLIGLWWLIFRFDGQEAQPQPDIVKQLGLSPVSRQSPASAPIPTQPMMETSHVR